MWRATAYAAAISLLATGAYAVVNSQCPVYMHGPRYAIVETQQYLRTLETAVGMFRQTHGRNPQSLDEMVALGVILHAPRDPYENEFVVRADGDPGIYSVGRDHRDDGGAGDDIVPSGKQYSCPVFYDCPSGCERANMLLLAGAPLAWLATAVLLLGAVARYVFIRAWGRAK